MSSARVWASGAVPRGGAGPALAILIVLGAALGLSPFAGGFYPSSIWVPAGLGLLAVLTAALVAAPAMPARRAIAAPLLMAALALLSLLSALWTDSVQRAVLEGNRLLVYSAVLALLVVLLRSDRAAGAAFAAFTVGALAVAGWVLAGMLRGDETIFLGGRLHEPLGYVNGQSSFFLLAVWPCLALAERRQETTATAGAARRTGPTAAGLALAAATLFAGLAVLGQSRGAVIAAAAAVLIVVLTLPGRLRRIVALLVLALCLAPALPFLLDVYGAGATDDSMRNGALALLAACGAAGGVWALLVALERRGSGAGLRPRRVVAIGVTAIGVLVAALGVASADRIERFADRQYTAFVALDEESGETASRLQSGAGNRYDYWRVALDVWRDHPVGGVGAGGYDRAYFARRATNEDIRQPHSLPLQVLAELGSAGGLLFAGAVLVIAGGAWRRIRHGGRQPVTVAALGVVTAWFVHAGVDWIHLLPGPTGVALVGAALLMHRPGSDDGAPSATNRAPRAAGIGRGRPPAARMAAAIAVGTAIALAALSVSRQGLTELYVDRAQAALARDPERALIEANRALRLDRDAVGAYYAKAAALARFDQAGPARSVLLDATRREPRNFVTWILLGDLAVRTGDLRVARSAYTRALRLNPREPGLARLAADPRAATRGSGGG